MLICFVSINPVFGTAIDCPLCADCYRCAAWSGNCCTRCEYDVNSCSSIKVCPNVCANGLRPSPPLCLCDLPVVCLSGSYVDKKGKCAKCPAADDNPDCKLGSTDSSNSTLDNITTCYVPASGCTLENEKGSYTFTSNCHYNYGSLNPLN